MNSPSKGIESTKAIEPAQIIVEQAGSRRITLSEGDNGIIHLELDGPPIRKLILSGGGAKGFAYSGAVTALEHLGVLPGLESVHGSSAGAIMAALIAAGMPAPQFDDLIDNTNLLALLDSSNASVGWLQRGLAGLGERAGQVVPGTAGGFTHLLLSVLPRIRSEALPLQTLIRNTARAAVLALIHDAHPTEVLVVRERLLAGGAVTFADLALLSRHIPRIKQLNITGTAMFSGAPQLVVFGAALTPDMDIAQAAHVSASLPVVFRQPGQQGLDFQVFDELTFFQDGGVLLNTPVPQLLDPGLATDLLSGADMLILTFEKSPIVSSRGGLKGFLSDWLADAPVTAQRELQNLDLKTFAAQTVVVPLRTERGDFTGALNGTLNFTMSAQVRNHLQDKLEQAVRAHLAERAEGREAYDFGSLHEALQSLDDDMLASVERVPAAAQMRAWRNTAYNLFAQLEAAIAALDLDTASGDVDTVLAALERHTTTAADSQWLVLQLNRYERPAFARLLDTRRVQSPLLTAARVLMRQREIRVIAGNIRKALIFPSLHLLWQTEANTELLLRADQQLLQARTAGEINQALDAIIDGYQSRNRLPVTLWTSQTVEQARAWRIEEGVA
ncbi:hypothetical protein PS3A_33220 [Pseudomonas sp. 3A(2025)]